MSKCMNKDEFIYRQNRIYKEIEECTLRLDKLERAVFHNQGGYMIALRHSNDVIESIQAFNEEVAKIIPIMNYDKCNIHTTMATYQTQAHFEPDKQMLSKISDILCLSGYSYGKEKMHYYDYLLDCSAIILAGKFNETFYNHCVHIVSALRENGIEFQYPWGTHITVCRFLENGSQEQVEEVKMLIHKHKKELQSIPPAIDIGHYKNDGQRFELYTYKKIIL